jgi:hypothetical protein
MKIINTKVYLIQATQQNISAKEICQKYAHLNNITLDINVCVPILPFISLLYFAGIQKKDDENCPSHQRRTSETARDKIFG